MNPRSFDSYVRTITASLLAMAITGATLWELINAGRNTLVLVAIAGPIIGGYFGAHVAHNGRGVNPRHTDYEMTVLSTQPPHGEGH